MNYSIKTNGNIRAKFEYNSDRDICIKALKEVYTNSKFEAVDNLDVEQAEEQTEEQAEEQAEEQTEEQAEEQAEEIKHPICPLNLYFEGDEDKCDNSKCDFDTERRECSTGCETKKEE